MKIDNKPQNTKVNEAILPNNSPALYRTIIQHKRMKMRQRRSIQRNSRLHLCYKSQTTSKQVTFVIFRNFHRIFCIPFVLLHKLKSTT